MPEPFPVFKVDENGDVYFDVHDLENPPGVSILGSSEVLRLCSPVFRAMLGEGFSEGRQLAENRRKRKYAKDTRLEEALHFPLKEDDAEAMLVVFRAVHHQPQEVPSLDVLSKLVTVCDKYDCFAPLKATCQAWLQEYLVRLRDAGFLDPLAADPCEAIAVEPGKRFRSILEIAYHFGLTNEFAEASGFLVLHDIRRIFLYNQWPEMESKIPLNSLCPDRVS
jgi:hypothetical protein